VDRLGARWLRLSSKVASGAIAHARLHQADRVFCGHTHKAQFCEREGVAYYNSGGWADSPPTYLTIDSEGVRIHEYHEPAEAARTVSDNSAFAEEDSEYEAVLN
jgi:predicted phosphodiesterase